jgi:uncharacterized protein YerC/small nuclear ribonucleoprotein (snRNP)-like protein
MTELANNLLEQTIEHYLGALCTQEITEDCIQVATVIKQDFEESLTLPKEKWENTHAAANDSRVLLAQLEFILAFSTEENPLFNILNVSRWIRHFMHIIEQKRKYDKIWHQILCNSVQTIQTLFNDQLNSVLFTNDMESTKKFITSLCTYAHSKFEQNDHVAEMILIPHTQLPDFVYKHSLRNKIQHLAKTIARPNMMEMLRRIIVSTPLSESTWSTIEGAITLFVTLYQEEYVTNEDIRSMEEQLFTFLDAEEYPELICATLIMFRFIANRLVDINTDSISEIHQRCEMFIKGSNKLVQLCAQHVSGYLNAGYIVLQEHEKQDEILCNMLSSIVERVTSIMSQDYEHTNYEYFYNFGYCSPPMLFLSTSMHYHVDYMHVLGIMDWFATSVCMIQEQYVIAHLDLLVRRITELFELFKRQMYITSRNDSVIIGTTRYMSMLFNCVLTQTISKTKDRFLPYVSTFIGFALDQIERHAQEEDLEEKLDYVYYDIYVMDYYSFICEMATSFSNLGTLQVFFNDENTHARIQALIKKVLVKKNLRQSARNFTFHLMSRFSEQYMLDGLLMSMFEEITTTEDVDRYVVNLVPTIMQDVSRIIPLTEGMDQKQAESKLHHFLLNNELCALGHLINRYISRSEISICTFQDQYLTQLVEIMIDSIDNAELLDSLTVCNYCVVLLRLSFLYIKQISVYFAYLAQLIPVSFWRMDEGEKKDCVAAVCLFIEHALAKAALGEEYGRPNRFLPAWKLAILDYKGEDAMVKRSLVLAKILDKELET